MTAIIDAILIVLLVVGPLTLMAVVADWIESEVK